MDDLQSALDRLMKDPAELERLSKMASELLGGAPEPEPEKPAAPDLSGLLGALRGAPPSDTQKLLQAMRPFLSQRRQEKLTRAMRAAKLVSVAETALGQMGGDDE